MRLKLSEMESFATVLRYAYLGITRNLAFIRGNPDAEIECNRVEIKDYANSAQDAAEKIAILINGEEQ